jgi:CRISPR/Cas system CSM-associated protein Csm3 (group 7 of RAMP superfamily)
MSRNIERRVIVAGELVCQTPVHVGGLDSQSASALALAVNGQGQFYLPGTSQAGPLRAWCAETFTPAEANALWGPPGDSDGGHASFVIVDDAVIGPGVFAAELRDGVGINRYTGTAAEGIKFDREILPAGTKLPFRLVFEELKGETRGAQILASLLQALQRGEVRLGAAKSRGLGKVTLEDLTVLEHKFGSRVDVLGVLRGEPKPSKGLELLCKDWKAHRQERSLIEIKIEWKPKGPFMVKAAVDGMVVDTLPLVSATESGLRLVLPGSSSKGAIRSQAERIVATLLGGDVDEKDFLKQLARFSLVTNLFGAPNSTDSESDEAKDWLPGLSALSIDDCFSEQSISAETLQHMLTGGGSGKDLQGWFEALPEYGGKQGHAPYLDPATQVAIDRWTGGASDGALFTVLEPWNFKWEDLVLTVDPARLPRGSEKEGDSETEPALAAIALLLLTLGDFVKGDVSLGFGTNRGFGAVEVKSISIKLPSAVSCHKGFSRNLMSALEGLSVKVLGEELKVEGAAVSKLRQAWTNYFKPAGAA